MADDCMLTTTDNPYDPFEDYDSWLMYDIEQGYNSCEYLGRVVNLTDDMSEKEIDEEITRAIDEIVRMNPTGLYTIAKPKDKNNNT